MRHIFTYILLILFNILVVNAQEKPMKDIESFREKVKQAASTVKTIESDFDQVKHLALFKTEIASKGRFYYKTGNKISLVYSIPSDYMIVINGEKIKIMSEGKKTVMNLKANKVMKEMQAMLAACMSGNLTDIVGYEMAFFEQSESYLVKVKPNNKSVREYIIGFDIYMDKKDLSVMKLKISESEQDYTEYLFHNKKFNTLKDDSKFAVN